MPPPDGAVHLWMRHEERHTERRAPIVPTDARRLVDGGARVTVEDSPHRAFPAREYAAAGCRIVDAGSWADAPPDAVVVGLKELPDEPANLVHRHVFFGHAFKGQAGAGELLARFARGGGTLLDLEYLTDDDGRRLAAFGYWAGYAGAALAVLHLRRQLVTPLEPTSREALDAALAAAGPSSPQAPRAVVIGALGRSGRGAREALAVAGVAVTGWDRTETRNLDKAALLAHDVLVNTVLTTRPVPPFLTTADLDAERRLRLVCDVTVDVTSDCNVLPIYDRTTTWEEPVRRLHPSSGPKSGSESEAGAGSRSEADPGSPPEARSGAASGSPPLDLIAIDNLPSLLPREASIAFSAELLPPLLELGSDASAWRRCRQAFIDACVAHGLPVPA